ncbi:MAG: hypothetical protein PHI50_00960 [Alphaproteobacteria bacterium]|nr:hypothetical protein [Alphaproteobacteria bacterium]
MKKLFLMLALLFLATACTLSPLVERDKMTTDEQLLIPPDYDLKPTLK